MSFGEVGRSGEVGRWGGGVGESDGGGRRWREGEERYAKRDTTREGKEVNWERWRNTSGFLPR